MNNFFLFLYFNKLKMAQSDDSKSTSAPVEQPLFNWLTIVTTSLSGVLLLMIVMMMMRRR
jgi:hypothetical protein